MPRWLVKTEPDTFGWTEQVAHGTEPWTGVRNPVARANLQTMRLGDRVFFYHSNIGKEIVGVVEVVREAYPDPTANPPAKGWGPKGNVWVAVDMRTVGPVKTPVTLAQAKADPALAEMALVRQARLSVQPVTEAEWAHVCRLAGWKEPAPGRKKKP